MRACAACLHVALETCVRKRERSSVQDGNKIKLFFFFYRFRVGASCLSNFVCPLPIYFSIGVWECWTRLNRLALTKQHKINTGDWGYNNTQQPLLVSNSLLSEMPEKTTHKNQEINGGEQEKRFFNN